MKLYFLPFMCLFGMVLRYGGDVDFWFIMTRNIVEIANLKTWQFCC
jgi:hypothetical protein